MWELSDQGRIFEKRDNAHRTLCDCIKNEGSDKFQEEFMGVVVL